ncbi:OsmC family protein, partial [Hydrogenivirga sp. 128-5-R1-1]|uniref:OsmC family protein n=1 Tax=Hydrogenivirga sp. 128-5-R1-1 TaxID=392423 RepID=UPI00015F3332
MAPVKEEKRVVELSFEDEKWLAKALNAEEIKDIDISSMKVKATDLMLMSLGYCFGITVQAYTNHKGYKIENVKIEVLGEKHPKENRYEKLTINVSFDSDLTEEQIKG